METKEFNLFDGISLTEKQKKELEEHQALSNVIVKLISRRIELKMTQRQLAEKSGVKQPVIARIEKFDVVPKMDTIIRLSKALNLEIGFVKKI